MCWVDLVDDGVFPPFLVCWCGGHGGLVSVVVHGRKRRGKRIKLADSLAPLRTPFIYHYTPWSQRQVAVDAWQVQQQVQLQQRDWRNVGASRTGKQPSSLGNPVSRVLQASRNAVSLQVGAA